MKRCLPALLLLVLCAATWAQTSITTKTTPPPPGPTQAWNVFTLPNEAVTPNWKKNRAYVPGDCPRPDVCADDNRFWEEWDFTNDFGPGASFNAVDAAFAAVASDNAVASQGKYQSVMLLMPLADAGYFWDNLTLMYNSAHNHGVGLEPVLFPKWKYGAEWCYLYPANAPASDCQINAAGGAVAYDRLVELMDFVQNLAGGCSGKPGTFNLPFAVWYGWTTSEFPYQSSQVLQNFWQSLPTSGTNSKCDLQASYITWLDSGYANNSDVKTVQQYVINQLKKPYWVNTELYSDTQIQQNYNNYPPYQTIITGYWNASDITSWAKGMCSKWNTAAQPGRLGVWTFYDRDVDRPYELYRSYINNQMAVVGSICSYR